MTQRLVRLRAETTAKMSSLGLGFLIHLCQATQGDGYSNRKNGTLPFSYKLVGGFEA
jgi:hypothetical protein